MRGVYKTIIGSMSVVTSYVSMHYWLKHNVCEDVLKKIDEVCASKQEGEFTDRFNSDEVLDDLTYRYFGCNNYTVLDNLYRKTTRLAEVMHPTFKISYTIDCTKEAYIDGNDVIIEHCPPENTSCNTFEFLECKTNFKVQKRFQ